MTNISPSADHSAAHTRSQFATNAIRDQAHQEQKVAERVREAQETSETERREARKIPGLGEAVDVTV